MARNLQLLTALTMGGLALVGCTSSTDTPVSAASSASSVSSARAGAATGELTTEQPTDTVTIESIPSQSVGQPEISAVSTEVPLSSHSGTAGDTVVSTATVAPTGYTPPPDTDAVEGDCPFLTKADVEAALGQRMGKAKIRAATPQPVCDFVRSDGSYLAKARVLQFATEAQARDAVDFYVPRDTSNPETKPAGWTGGSMRTDTGSIVGVSKDGHAVIIDSDRIQTVDTRQLVLAAITNLNL